MYVYDVSKYFQLSGPVIKAINAVAPSVKDMYKWISDKS